MRNRALITGASAILLQTAGCGGQPATTTGEEPAATTPVTAATATASADSPKLVSSIRGLAEVEVTKPLSKRVGDEIDTTINVKNTSTTNSIAGLTVDEYWYDKGGAPVTGDTFRHRTPLQPGEIIEVMLRTPVNPKMDRNQYQFAHANGNIKTTVVPKL
jgi:hypothetical protein